MKGVFAFFLPLSIAEITEVDFNGENHRASLHNAQSVNGGGDQSVPIRRHTDFDVRVHFNKDVEPDTGKRKESPSISRKESPSIAGSSDTHGRGSPSHPVALLETRVLS